MVTAQMTWVSPKDTSTEPLDLELSLLGDGEVTEGMGAVNQAPITGESAPVPKETGDDVYAGTINGEGTLMVRATKAASDTVLARIIRMVGDAHARRAPVEQWVAKFARIYTPIVMALAVALAVLPPLVAGGAWGYWFYNALVLLVIACPCALVISTPVSIVASLALNRRAQSPSASSCCISCATGCCR